MRESFRSPILVSICLVFALLACKKQTGSNDRLSFVRPSHVLGWEWIPSTQRTNSRTLLGKEIKVRPTIGVLRVLLVGDSFLENPRLVELLYEKARKRGYSKVEFLNGGMGGYATDHYLLWYHIYGHFLKPDVVLTFWFVGNDLAGILKSQDYSGYQKPFFTLEEGELTLHNYPLKEPEKRMPSDKFTPTVQGELKQLLGSQQALADKQRKKSGDGFSLVRFAYKVHYFLYVHLPPYRFLKDRLMSAWSKASPKKRERQLALGDLWYLRHLAYSFFVEGGDLEAAWKLNNAILRRLRSEVRQDGSKFALCLVPHVWQVDNAIRNLQAGCHSCQCGAASLLRFGHGRKDLSAPLHSRSSPY